jgi:hypothetical protein
MAAVDSPAIDSRDASWLCMVVENLTACAVGARWQKSITRCEDPRCTGVLALRRTGDACEWYCSRCAQSGAVVGFRDGPHDLSAVARADANVRGEAVVYTRADEIDSARRQSLSQQLRYVLAIATAHPEGYLTLACVDDELSSLTTALADALTRSHDDDLLPLQRLLARCDAALLAQRSREVPPVTFH